MNAAEPDKQQHLYEFQDRDRVILSHYIMRKNLHSNSKDQILSKKTKYQLVWLNEDMKLVGDDDIWQIELIDNEDEFWYLPFPGSVCRPPATPLLLSLPWLKSMQF